MTSSVTDDRMYDSPIPGCVPIPSADEDKVAESCKEATAKCASDHDMDAVVDLNGENDAAGSVNDAARSFLDSLPDGMPLWKSSLVSFVICVIASTFQFVLLPNSNPLKDPERKGIWHCALGCSLVWIPISMMYIVFMTNRWVLRGTGVAVMLCDLGWMWASSTVLFTCSVLFWNSIWFYPFPFGGFQSACLGLIALGCVMWALLYGRFKKRNLLQDDAFRGHLFRGVMVFAVFVWSLIMLVVIFIMLGAAQYVPKWACAIAFPVVRHFAKSVSEVLLRLIDEDATIVAENLVMTCFGVGLTLLVGNGGDAYLAVGIAVVDISFGLVMSLQMQDNKVLRAWLRFRRCGGLPTDQVVQRAIQVGRATFTASEVGEVIVPITYVVVFLIVHSGPHAGAFTGIGTTDFGVQPPKDMRSFLQTMAVLIGGDAVGTVILKILVNKLTGLDTIAEMRKFYNEYGVILTIQTIWILHTAFCAVMILCGLDYSFKFEMAH